MSRIIYLMISIIFCSSRSYSQFVIQDTPATNFMTSISSPTNNVAWASGDSQQVIRTTNSGLNWKTAKGDLPTDLRFFNIWAVDSLTAHICISNAFFTTGYIFKTSNGGVNWIKTYEGGAFINAISFVNTTTGFAFGDPVDGRWTLLRTTDAGSTWDSIGLYLQALNNELGMANSLFYNDNKIWFGSQSGKIYSSTNSGHNWIATQTVMGDVQELYFNDPETGVGLAVSNYYHNGNNIVKSNNGINWNPISFFTADERIPSVTGMQGTSMYWLVFPKKIYKTINAGETWDLVFNSTSTSSFEDITVSRSGSLPRNIFAIRHDKKIVVGNTGISSNINTVSTELPDLFELHQNYPNPFNPLTKISFSIKKSGQIKLDIYNQNGQLVSELVNKFMSAGSYSISFDAKNLSSGVYYYRMVVGSLSDVKKMILIK